MFTQIKTYTTDMSIGQSDRGNFSIEVPFCSVKLQINQHTLFLNNLLIYLHGIYTFIYVIYITQWIYKSEK